MSCVSPKQFIIAFNCPPPPSNSLLMCNPDVPLPEVTRGCAPKEYNHGVVQKISTGFDGNKDMRVYLCNTNYCNSGACNT